MMCKGVLCRQYQTPDGSDPYLQIVVPMALHKEVLLDLHEGTMGEQLGADKTLGRLKEHFYWPGHYNNVKEWCQLCWTCASRKNPAPKPRAPLKSIKTSYPVEIVAMDMMSPLPESTAGNRYVLVVADYFTQLMESQIKKLPLLHTSWLTSSSFGSHQHNSCILIKDVISNWKLSQNCASCLASPNPELHLTTPQSD